VPMRPFLPLLVLLCASCGGEEAKVTPQEQAEAESQVEPPAPGEPGGLPDDRTPVPEAPFTSGSAQGAAAVLETYYALIEQGNYAEAYHLREPGERGPTAEQFAASFKRYLEYHANIGRPSDPVGAAGSLYVEVPVQIYGRLDNGKPFSSAGTVTLRRSNRVPGGNDEWRIYPTG
jgi:hypothetical protein